MSEQTPSPTPLTEAHEDFGPNQWLVDELRAQWSSDPGSVDPSWAQYFSSTSPRGNTPSVSPTTTDTASSSPAEPPTKESSDGASEGPSHRSEPRRGLTPPQRIRERHAKQGFSVQATAATTPHKRSSDAPSEDSSAPTTATKSSSATATSTAAPSRRNDAAPAPAKQENDPVSDAKPSPSNTSDRPAKADDKNALPSFEPIEPVAKKLRGPANAVVRNMEESLSVPTATSVRDVPVKLLFDNRLVINNHLQRNRQGKVSFTHLIGWAMIEAIQEVRDMNNGYAVIDGKPHLLEREDINFGLAIDMPKPDGTRSLVVPNIKAVQRLDFRGFWKAYENVVKKARSGALTMDDFTGTTVSLTNPGGIGTVHSIPRLMAGQGTIVGVGAMDYPAPFQGASAETVAELAISKVMTLTSTYDHRIIQGAASGEFLRAMSVKLLGEDGFYDRIFASLRIPYEPVRWVKDNPFHEDDHERLARVMDLIHSYRVRGHLTADTDPLHYRVRTHPDLDIATHGLTLWDLEREFPTRGLGGKNKATLREILGILRDAYSRRIGAEYMHITDPEERTWLQERIEAKHEQFSKEKLTHIMDRLNAAEAFEMFLQTKFVGQKRFSLEGGESVIPLLDAILQGAASDQVEEVCIGMAHRGRLNVLSNLAGKSFGQIFREFNGQMSTAMGSGDVKYHLGTEGIFTAIDGKTTKVLLAANPSHLEAVNPVLEGIVRAKQDKLERPSEFPVLPILIHGDAAFAGQGVVTETLNLSELRGYRTGGTIHVIINNQIGFTTEPDSSRSSFYSTDVAKGTQLPIFHVNGDDPEACVRVAELAFEYRQKFNRDVVIDMVCYRRRGHNEGDDPSMTQPQMYKIIGEKATVRKQYAADLIERGDLTEEEAEQLVQNFQKHLDQAFAEAKDIDSGKDIDETDAEEATGIGYGIQVSDETTEINTAVSASVLERIGDAHVEYPEDFTIHPKIGQLAQKRQQMSHDGKIDWGYGEILAFGSLLMEGTRVRLAGQDSRRGTFTQRQSVFIDQENHDTYTPLLHLSEDQARFNVYDSSLSEYAALGFEYGYAVESPDSLVLWEAQFGDFVNGAQTMIDEYISASEQKWGQTSPVVMLLPHGYEGQGPDHSSARIERFLQLCAQNNMRVAMPSTPANHFHLLRRQVKNTERKPLIVFTPKSMLRNKAAVSAVEDFTTGSFQPVIADTTVDAAAVKTVLLTSGKVYWDLVAYRAANNIDDVAIVRVEQLYPLPAEKLRDVLGAYPNAELTWVQEEPENQGAWTFMAVNFAVQVGRTLRVAARPASASPATGSSSQHKKEQQVLIETAFSL